MQHSNLKSMNVTAPMQKSTSHPSSRGRGRSGDSGEERRERERERERAFVALCFAATAQRIFFGNKKYLMW